jgi:hypothetical protein
MHFEDLSPIRYSSGPCDAREWRSPLLAVGWLEHPHPFSTGSLEDVILKSLDRWVDLSWDFYPAYAFRGLHDCSLCLATGGSAHHEIRSYLNLWIPGPSAIYLAPAMITHYIRDHGYRPPHEFIAAVMSCPEYGTPEYCSALRSANGGIQPPLLTIEPAPVSSIE